MHPFRYIFSTFCLISTILGHLLKSPNTGADTEQQTLQDCLASNSVPLILNSSSNWSFHSKPYNLRLQYVPAVITFPTNHRHVSSSIKCASQLGIKVQARSGGHSYGSYSIGGENGSLIIDLQNFNTISLNNSTGIVTVGGGVRLGNLGGEIFRQGHRALPHGTFPGVGVGGHYTHGGFGYSSRLWGLALDSIVGMDVALANGSHIYADSVTHPDIYYALRGAADSFGVVTTFYLQTQVAPTRVVSFSASFASLLKSVEKAAEVILRLQTFATSSKYMNRNINLEIYLDIYGNFTLRGWYFGNKEHFTNIIFPAMLAGIPLPDRSTVLYLDWLAALEDIAEGESLSEPLAGYNNHQTFYSKSVVTRESKPLTQASLKSFFAYVVERGPSSTHVWQSLIALHGGIDSQINLIPSGATAYSHRDTLWTLQNVGATKGANSPWSQDITTFIEGITDALISAQKDGEFLAYPNYLDPELTAREAAVLYYGLTTYRKLAKMKKELDPLSVFWNPQAIGNADV